MAVSFRPAILDFSVHSALSVWSREWHPRVQLSGFHTLLSLFSHTGLSDSLWPHGLQHARLPSFTVSQGLLILMSVELMIPSNYLVLALFSFYPQSFPESGSSLMSQPFLSGGQSIRASASASVISMNIQDWFPLGLTGWLSLQSKGLSRFFSNITIQKHQFFGAQLSL